MNISVIVPIYNVERYLEECLDSLLHQTKPFYEIILVNDGSTDKSLEICERYCEKADNLRLYSQENRGQGAARNAGMKLAGGEYIIFVDSDDYIRPNTNEALEAYLRTDPVEAACYNAEIQYDIPTDEREDAFMYGAELNGFRGTGMELFQRSFPNHYTGSACLGAYKRTFLLGNQIAFSEGIVFEDRLFSLQVITNAKDVRILPDIFYVRRCREGSTMTSGLSEKKCRDLAASQLLSWNYVAESPVWQKEREMMRRYVSFRTVDTFCTLSQYPDRDVSSELEQSLIRLFMEKLLPLFLERRESWIESLALALMLKGEENTGELAAEFEREACLQKLSRLPFHDKEARIAIYGVGLHTSVLLDLYEETVGDIRCELYFLATAPGEGQRYRGQAVLRYTEVPGSVDYVVLSSRLYQDEMEKNMRSIGFDEGRILSLYDGTDFCDLTMIYWARGLL